MQSPPLSQSGKRKYPPLFQGLKSPEMQQTKSCFFLRYLSAQLAQQSVTPCAADYVARVVASPRKKED